MDIQSINSNTLNTVNNLRPLLPLSRCLGIWPCSNRYNFTWKQIFASFFVLFCVKLTLFYVRWLDGFDNLTDELVAVSVLVLPSLVHLIHLIVITIKIKEFKNLIPNVLSPAAPHKLLYPKTWTLLIAFAVLANEFYGIYASKALNVQNVLTTLLWTHVQLCPILVTLIFGTIVEYYSSTIRNMSRSMRTSSSNVIPCTNKFHNIIRTVTNLVPLFDVQILAIVVVMLIQIVLNLFKIVARALINYGDVLPMIFNINKVAINWLSLFLLCNACEAFNGEVDYFHRLRFNLVCANKCLSNNAKLRVCINVEERAKFTAHRFFHLGHQLLTSMTATVATYLVILLQFGRL